MIGVNMFKTLSLCLLFEVTMLSAAYVMLPFGGLIGNIGFVFLGCGVMGVLGIPMMYVADSDMMNQLIENIAQWIADRILG